ncbi:hypothetical protein ABZ934_07150 [Streptomyces sp. NPDC046557]|uniref:hypothetical protein n=1 Tax=Streptomyces sp. NPDC046557 TaxID=3155372 RepID=UPI0034091DD8
MISIARCTAVATTVAATALSALLWAAPAEAAGPSTTAVVTGTDDFVWGGATHLVPELPCGDLHFPQCLGDNPDDFVWGAPQKP